MCKTEVFFESQWAILEKHLNNATSSITAVMAYLTHEPIFNILVRKAKEGVKVRLLIRDDEINTMTGIDYQVLNTLNGEFSYHKKVNHRFCVIDTRFVLSGSFCWNYDSIYNIDDVILCDDHTIAAKYITQYSKIKHPELFTEEALKKASQERTDARNKMNEKRYEQRRKRMLYGDEVYSIKTTVKSILMPMQEFGFTGTTDTIEAMAAFSVALGQRAQAAMFAGQTEDNFLLDIGVNTYFAMYEACFVEANKHKLDLPLFVLTALHLESSIKRKNFKRATTEFKREVFECIYNTCKEGFPTQVQFTCPESIVVMDKFCQYLQAKY